MTNLAFLSMGESTYDELSTNAIYGCDVGLSVQPRKSEKQIRNSYSKRAGPRWMMRLVGLYH